MSCYVNISSVQIIQPKQNDKLMLQINMTSCTVYTFVAHFIYKLSTCKNPKNIRCFRKTHTADPAGRITSLVIILHRSPSICQVYFTPTHYDYYNTVHMHITIHCSMAQKWKRVSGNDKTQQSLMIW